METPQIPYQSVNGCVFRLYWGEKYVVIKCKTFARAKTLIETSLSYHFKTGMHDHLYEKFFEYIKFNPDHHFKPDILYQSDNPYHLLIFEQQELDKGKQDTNCMNIYFDAYIPKLIQGKRKAWINRGHYLNFRMWLKKHKETADGQRT